MERPARLPRPDVSLHVPGVRDKEAAARIPGEGCASFVVPAGTYDVFVRDAPASWHTQIEVAANRTRLWIPRSQMTTPASDIELVQRLILAAALGAALGIERELRQKSAGLRTNILIAVGSALFTIMSIEMASEMGTDPSRIAAQIVTGIGFLGAGAIMRTGGGVQGLTTAATVWVNAAVGVAAGGGRSHLALIATGVTLSVLLVLVPIERVIERFSARKGLATIDKDPGNDAIPS